jgi:outer membrane protein assembly factor BamB
MDSAMYQRRMDSQTISRRSWVRLFAFAVSVTSIAASAAMVVCDPSGIALAQRPRGGMMMNQAQQQLDGMIMPVPREVLILLQEAQDSIEKKQWTEATLSLGMLLGLEDADTDDLTGVDFFLIGDDVEEVAPGNAEPTQFNTVFKRAFALAQSLPSEATKFVDLRYGVKASQLLEQAIADSDWSSMEMVAGRYSFTTAGQDACVILSEHWLRKGDARRASRFLAIVSRQRSALARIGAELGILQCAVHTAAGMPSKATITMQSTQALFSKFAFDWSGTKIAWDNRATPIKQAKELIDSLGLGDGGRDQSYSFNKVVRQPYYLGGAPSRNAETATGTPLPILKWHSEMHESNQHKENLARGLKSKLSDRKSTCIPSRSPISVGKWIINSTFDQRIVAIDTQTGLFNWECSYSGMPMGFKMDRFAARDIYSAIPYAPEYLTKRVWGETALGLLSSDGKRIFALNELPAIDVSASFALGQNARVSKPQAFRNYNVLQCWSIPDEGKIQWEVGGEKSATEPKLAGALFLGAPLPIENSLYIVGELNNDVYLFAIAPETGKLQWRQPLSVNAMAIAGDAFRRSVGASPAADGSILVCTTLSGYLVAFDTVSHSLLWSFKYPMRNTVAASNQFGMFGQMEQGDFEPFVGRSSDVSVVIEDDVVLFAPPDGDSVYAISLADGRMLWKSRSEVKVIDEESGEESSVNKYEQARYVAGAWNNIGVIVCQTSVIGLDLKSFEEKWLLDLPGKSQVCGRGVRKEGAYYLPTTIQEVIKIDLEKGSILEQVKMDQPLGNLVSVGDRLVSSSPFQLDCYEIREATQSVLKEELQKNSISRSGLTRQAELALSKGDFDESLKFLEQAKNLEPGNLEVMMTMNKVGMAALNADFDKYVDRVNLDNELAFDRERMPYLRLVSLGLQKRGRYRDALVKLIEMSEQRTSQRQDQVTDGELFSKSTDWSVQQDRWISTQIKRCFESLTPQERIDFQPTLEKLVVDLKNLPASVRRLRLNHLGGMPGLESLQIEAASDLIRQHELAQAEKQLLADASDRVYAGLNEKVSTSPALVESDNQAKRNDLLAQIYVQVRRYPLALQYLGGDQVRLNALMKEAIEREPTQSAAAPLSTQVTEASVKPASEWPSGDIDVVVSRPLVNTLIRQSESMTPCRWKSRVGDALNGWSISTSQGTWNFSSLDGQSYFQLFEAVGKTENNTIPLVHSVDSIAIIELNRQLFAVNTLLSSNADQDRLLLWRENFEAITPEIERGRGRIAILERNSWGLPVQRSTFRVVMLSRHGVVVLHEDDLICIDITSGKRLWTQSGFRNCQFASAGSALQVLHPRLNKILQLDIRDGEHVKEVPFDLEGWNTIASVDRFWVMGSSKPKTYSLQVVDSNDGRIVLSEDFSIDAKIAISDQTGIVILNGTGNLVYLNLRDEKIYRQQVEVEGLFSFVGAQRFGDTILVLPHASSQSLDSIAVAPDIIDPLFAPVAGRIIALSAKDGTQVWKQNNLARTFFIPLAQDRDTPIAFFVRRLTLSKVADVNQDLCSVAMLDLRDGRVLYNQDDLPSIRGLGFTQQVFPQENKMRVSYLGTNLDVSWKEGPSSMEPKFDFGDIKYREFRATIEKRILDEKEIDKQRAKEEPRNGVPKPALDVNDDDKE